MVDYPCKHDAQNCIAFFDDNAIAIFSVYSILLSVHVNHGFGISSVCLTHRLQTIAMYKNREISLEMNSDRCF